MQQQLSQAIIVSPILLTRQQASEYIGIDPKSFDKYFRSNPSFKRFMVGSYERYTIEEINNFIARNLA